MCVLWAIAWFGWRGQRLWEICLGTPALCATNRAVVQGNVERQAEMLANRVRKNLRHLRKWARRCGVSCYRAYDRDIPEVPLVIDYYEGRLHVAEFCDWSDDEVWARLGRLVDELEIAPSDVYVKSRKRQRGLEQYQNRGDAANRFEVREGGHSFLVNLIDYHDTGLFLDHRQTRAMVQNESRDKRVLNLFCYTGAFSVYAAAGGARETLGVDLSATYLKWARDNLDLNGFGRDRHRLLRGDVMEELLNLANEGERFDLAVVDPPTFSNSKSTQGTFDLQRDYVELLRRVADLLETAGTVYFSSNNRRFKFDPKALGQWFGGEEITYKTIPEDFRDKKSHRAFRFQRS
jgi:23S rRNA G2069 N7-methylase RlmK/C1962 C5-methylase RlmI